MTRYLVVNADDYGLCGEISSGIIDAHTNGIVTATSVVTVGDYFENGLAALIASNLSTGIHLTIVGGETPLTGPIKGLTDGNGRFYTTYAQVVPRILSRRYEARGLERELFEQVSRLKDTGLEISHLDSHQHLHLLPGIRDMAIRIAKKFGIKWVRVPRSHRCSPGALGMNFLSRGLKPRLRHHHLRYTDNSLGFDAGGNMDESTLATLITHCRQGTNELIFHPGHDASHLYDWGYNWEQELRAAKSSRIRRLIGEQDIILTDYSKIE
ncbi:MAG: ChbG/HpnK family deacetylase [Desulfobacteraceae bacterium]|nr:ChbG/HpnK family deacetylase [Desulfobacteraceae bacterium]